MSKQERKVIKSLTLQNLVEIFRFIQKNIDEDEKDKIAKMAVLISTATKELEKEPAQQNIRLLLQPMRETTSFGAGFGFGPHNKALGYLSDCVEREADIDFSDLYALFEKPRLDSAPLLWMRPETRYAVDSAASPPVDPEEKDPGFKFL